MPTILDKSHKSLKVQNWIKKSWIPHHHWYLPHSTVSSSQHVQGRVSNIHWAYLFWPSPHHLGNTVYTKHMEVTSQLIIWIVNFLINLISIQLYLKHFSQIRFFIKIISAYEDKWHLVCHGFTDCAISNLSWSSKKKKAQVPKVSSVLTALDKISIIWPSNSSKQIKSYHTEHAIWSCY